MSSYEDATSRPHGYLILDLKQTTDDQQRLKTNILPGEIAKFLHEQSYRQPPLANAMYDAEQRMKEIMEAPQLSVVEKNKIYSDQLNRFLTFKNKMDVPAQAPVQRTPLVRNATIVTQHSIIQRTKSCPNKYEIFQDFCCKFKFYYPKL